MLRTLRDAEVTSYQQRWATVPARLGRQRQVLLIAVGGASGVGKSTLAEGLVHKYASPLTELGVEMGCVAHAKLPRYSDGQRDCVQNVTNT